MASFSSSHAHQTGKVTWLKRESLPNKSCHGMNLTLGREREREMRENIAKLVSLSQTIIYLSHGISQEHNLRIKNK